MKTLKRHFFNHGDYSKRYWRVYQLKGSTTPTFEVKTGSLKKLSNTNKTVKKDSELLDGSSSTFTIQWKTKGKEL